MNVKDFLIWLKQNNYYQYKDGTWYTTNERPYLYDKQRQYYNDGQLLIKFLNSK